MHTINFYPFGLHFRIKTNLIIEKMSYVFMTLGIIQLDRIKAEDIAHNCNGLVFEWEKSGIIQYTCGLGSFR